MNKLMRSTLSLALAILPITSTNAADLICTKEYMPVCGIDGETYGNKCMAGNTVIAYEGACARGSEKSETQPSNATSCSSYNDGCNTCHAGSGDMTACTMMFCEQPSQPYCLVDASTETGATDEEVTMCTMQYEPVCGMIDGELQTYGNSCVAGAEKATVVHNGECITPAGSTNPMTTSQKAYRDSVLVTLSTFSAQQRTDLIVALQDRLEKEMYTAMVSIMTPEQNAKHFGLMTILRYIIEHLSLHH